jgi:phosphoglycolate phosphatase/pyrophosphatase PpaX
MKYKCLLIDHDDTTVDSTPIIHHVAHLEQMRRLNRSNQAVSLEEWFRINYHPGLRSFLTETLRLSPEEEEICYQVWREYTTTLVPSFFPGILPLLHRFKLSGGTIVVVSHSEEDIIRSHYEQQNEISGFFPDFIIGWTGDRSKNKPSLWPLEQTLSHFSLSPRQVLVVDDLKPGILMARNGGVDSVAVGWSHHLEEIKADISRLSTYYADSVEELEKIIFPIPSGP